MSPLDLLPRNHGPAAFATSLGTQGKTALRTTELGWTSARARVVNCCRGHLCLWTLGKSPLSVFWRVAGLLLPRDAVCYSMGSTSLEKWFHYQLLFRAALLLSRLGKSEHFKEALGSRKVLLWRKLHWIVPLHHPGGSSWPFHAGKSWMRATRTDTRAAELCSVPAFPQCGI